MFWEYWDPFEELERMRRRMKKLMKTTLMGFEESFPVDISETDEDLIIKADLPGFDKDEISVKLTESTLEISAQHKEKKVEETERVYRAERKFGALRRFLTLPVEVNPDTAKAKLEKGILEIRVKKAKPSKKAKKVEVE